MPGRKGTKPGSSTGAKVKLTPRQRVAADQLKQTIKTTKGGGIKPKSDTDERQSENYRQLVEGGQLIPPDRFNQKFPGATAEQRKQYADWYASRTPKPQDGIVPRLQRGLQRFGAMVQAGYAIGEEVPGLLSGDPNALAHMKNILEVYPQVIREGVDIQIQTSVGGTKGSAKVVDRSEAVKRAWATRRKLYGTSGKKDD